MHWVLRRAWLGLESAGLLAGFLEARVVGTLEIILDYPRDPVDRMKLEITVQHFHAVLPAGGELELRVERLEVVVGQVRIDEE